jgi:hypothetical protein
MTKKGLELGPGRLRALLTKTKERPVRLKDSECAKRAGVTPRTLRRWEADPRVRYPKADIVLNRRYRWLHEVEQWEEENPDFAAGAKNLWDAEFRN